MSRLESDKAKEIIKIFFAELEKCSENFVKRETKKIRQSRRAVEKMLHNPFLPDELPESDSSNTSDEESNPPKIKRK